MSNPATIVPNAARHFKTKTIALSVSDAQRTELLDAFAAGNFRTASEAMRAMLLGYARSEAVRAAFSKWLAAQPRDFDR